MLECRTRRVRSRWLFFGPLLADGHVNNPFFGLGLWYSVISGFGMLGLLLGSDASLYPLGGNPLVLVGQ